MVNVSKNKMAEGSEKKIREQFFKTVIDLHNPRDTKLLQELFTTTEQIMLAKRLAAIFLLNEGVSPYLASKLLRISKTTAGKIRSDIDHGHYSYVTERMRGKKIGTRMRASIKILLRVGAYGMGKHRWGWLDEILGPSPAYTKRQLHRR